MKKMRSNRLVSLLTSLSLISAAHHCFPESIIKTNSVRSSETITASRLTAAGYDEVIENPYNYQYDMEAPYNNSGWVQPKEWNSPTINIKNYNGGIMLYFDKIGLEPEENRGKVQRVYFSMTGATEPVADIKFHVFYDTRLKVKKNSNGKVITPGRGLASFTTDSAMVEDGQLVFYAHSDDTLLEKCCLFTIDFIVPENAEPGEVYPFGIYYVDDGIAYDTFIGSEKNDPGKLQMTYVFKKGLYNGYIRMNGEKKTTTTVTTTPPSTTTTVSAARYRPGDVTGDGFIDASDASSVLEYYAMISTNQDGGFNDKQKFAADVDRDGAINAADATYILAYYSYLSTTNEYVMPLEDFICD